MTAQLPPRCGTGPDRRHELHQAAGRALVQARLYQARERLLMSAPPDLVTSGEEAFRRLIGIRDAIRG